MAVKPFSSAQGPPRLILVGELSGVIALSAHERKQPGQFNNAKNICGFVDGYAAFIPIYWNGQSGTANFPGFYDPPPGYDYSWFGK